MFTEGSTLFSIGNLKPLFAAVWPQCWSTHEVCNRGWIDSIEYLEILGIIVGQILVGFEGDWVGRKFGLVQNALIMTLGLVRFLVTRQRGSENLALTSIVLRSTDHARRLVGRHPQRLGHLLRVVPVHLRNRRRWRVSHDGDDRARGPVRRLAGADVERPASPRPQRLAHLPYAGLGSDVQPGHPYRPPHHFPPRLGQPSLQHALGSVDVPRPVRDRRRHDALARLPPFLPGRLLDGPEAQGQEAPAGCRHGLRHQVVQALRLALWRSHDRHGRLLGGRRLLLLR